MRQALILTITTLLLGVSISAQNLDKMSEQKRKEKLLEIAKESVMKHGPGYYRDVYSPIIEHRYVNINQTDLTLISIKEHDGRSFYTVEYKYDDTVESMIWYYAAKVYIWGGDNGKTYKIIFGNGFGFCDLDKPETRGEKPRVMSFKSHPPIKKE